MKNLFLILFALFLSNGSTWAQTTVTIGEGTGTSYYDALTPYTTFYTDAQHQMLFTKAELLTAGLAAGNITALAFNVHTADSATMNAFTISVQHTSLTTATFLNFGWTECYSGDVATTVGWNTYVFNTAFNWNGSESIMFKICFDNDGATGSTSSLVYYSQNAGMHVAQYGNDAAGCEFTTAGFAAQRPNVQITGVGNVNPTINVEPNSIDLGYAPSGSSTEGQYTISGISLSEGPIVVSAPAGFGVSLSDAGPYTSTIDVAYTAPTLGVTNIFVQFTPDTAESLYTGNIINVGGGADSKDVAVSGSSRFFDSYCMSTVDYAYYSDITHVKFGSSLDNTTSCESLEGSQGTGTGVEGKYSNFIANPPTNIARGQVVPLTVEITQCGGGTHAHGVKVYIDFNQNGDLTDMGEEFNIWAYAESVTHTINFDIDIPVDAALGYTLMRVVDRQQEAFGPCETGYGSGETEDYKVNISSVGFGSLEGYVTATDEKGPIEGAVVSSGQYACTTDTEGYYNIAYVEVGTYTFTCEAEGYLPETIESIGILINQTTSQDFTLEALPQGQTIILNQGWNAWSSYTHPVSELSMEDVMAPISDDMLVTQYFTELYYPQYGINTIGNISNSHGYLTKLSAPAEITITGNMANTTITLSEGWNLMPVLSACNVATADLFASMSELMIAVDPVGSAIYFPGGGTYTMTELLPGKAYWVKVNASVEITFPECQK